jgi:hypothetical protein
MKKILFLLSLCAFASGALAQDNAAKQALAREAIAAMQVDKMLDNMAGQIRQMAMQRAQLPPTATAEQRARFDVFMGRVTDLAMAEVKTMITRLDVIYAEVYTEAELKAIVSFFNTAEGKSMLAKQPQVMTRLMPLMQEMQAAMLPKLQKLAQDFEAENRAAAAAAAPATPGATPAPADPNAAPTFTLPPAPKP